MRQLRVLGKLHVERPRLGFSGLAPRRGPSPWPLRLSGPPRPTQRLSRCCDRRLWRSLRPSDSLNLHKSLKSFCWQCFRNLGRRSGLCLTMIHHPFAGSLNLATRDRVDVTCSTSYCASTPRQAVLE
ncbi:hypothetical protein LY76DRAFT_35109 [Colletotrichum caudatum]|nr:hypothetical protein LY76DRAFT_35109 [Colletotrichum caudatum]